LLAMPGEHNRLNAALAYEALKAVGLTEEEIFEGLATFPGVEGRLQLISNLDGVRIYNDNNATTPQATSAALEALGDGKQNVILIAGGADKNIDTSILISAIRKHCRQVILTPGNGTDKLLGQLTEGEFKEVLVVENLKQAVEEARLQASAASVILFSPAFSSFAQYKNEYERNDEFVALIKNYEQI